MEREFLDYTEALALKELGFDEPCFAFFNGTHLSFSRFDTLGKLLDIDKCLEAPTFSQAFRWFREKYNLDVTFRKIDYGPENQFTGYYFSIYKGNELIDIHGADKKCKLYEEAELKCLKALIEIVKEKQL
jgi:hypothetical protein